MSAIDLNIRYVPGFVENPDMLFAQARAELQWDARMAARETASCGLAYNYSGVFYPDIEMPGLIAELAARVAEIVQHPITNCLANYYTSGDSRMGFHSDSAAGVVPGSTTSIVSLGASRPLTFRSKRSEPDESVVELEAGSLLVMAASVQTLWKHALLPTDGSSARMSLTFRHLTREPLEEQG